MASVASDKRNADLGTERSTERNPEHGSYSERRKYGQDKASFGHKAKPGSGKLGKQSRLASTLAKLRGKGVVK